MKPEIYMRLLLAAIVATLLAACASIGRPEGGPRDKLPPVFVKSNPTPGSVNFDNKRISITFDENISLEKASEKVVISPAQKSMPQISAQGKTVNIELRDTMLPNTTYTIDFSDAIRDLNENNVLEEFAIDFSTGDSIDSLQISGMVFQASNLEPAQGMLIGVHSNLSDTALTKTKFERIAKTNSYGQFTVRNLKPGTYRIFAVNDVNRDYMWDRSEDIAFYDTTISPSASSIIITDSLKANDGSDSIAQTAVTQFYPNDVLLTWFNEGYKAQYLKDYKRPERHKLTFEFGAPSDSLPEITLINAKDRPNLKAEQWSRLDAALTGDSLQYWITDTTISAMDTLLLATRYMRTDTLDQLTWTVDTLKLTFREPKKKKEEKKKKSDEDSDSINVPEMKFISFNVTSGSTHHIYAPLSFTASEPIDTIYPDSVHLEVLRDTIWTPIDLPPIKPAKHHPLLNFSTTREWEPGTKYRLTIDSAAIISSYGIWNKHIAHEFTTHKLEDYSALFFKLSGISSGAIVELLNTSDAPVRTAPVENGEAAFLYLDPGTYYARLYIDANGNGKYDIGNVASGIQPEEMYYYPRKLTLKKNWDVEQSWNIYEIPIDKQKPDEIKKNKPEKRRNWEEEENKNKKRNNTDEEEDEYYDDGNFGSSGHGNSGFNTGNIGGGFRTNNSGNFR